MNGHLTDDLSPVKTNGSLIKQEPIELLNNLKLESNDSPKTSDETNDVKPSRESLHDLKPCTSGSSETDEKDAPPPLKSPTKTTSKNGFSFACPHTRKFFASTFSKLPAKSHSNKDMDFLNEIIIDEFSLLVFHSIDDYKVGFVGWWCLYWYFRSLKPRRMLWLPNIRKRRLRKRPWKRPC